MINDNQFEQLLLSIGERRVEHKQSAFERHAQTVLVGAITLIIAWVGISIERLGDEQANMISETKVMQYQIETLSNSVGQWSNINVSKYEFQLFLKRTNDRLLELEEHTKLERND